MTTLRDYQRAAIDGVYEWFANQTGNPLVVVPTGGGKSVIIAELVREILTQWPEERILVVTHVRELIDQNYRALLRSWSQAPAGIYSAGLGRRDARAKIVFAGVQSIFRRVDELGWFSLVLIDEAHLIPGSGTGMYRTLLDALRVANPDLRMVGFTATPFRTDSGRLDKGDDRLFHGHAYNIEVGQLIRDGYLSNLTNQGVRSEIDTTAVHTKMGEFVADELEEAATSGDLVQRSVEEMVKLAGDRRSWLVFCCGLAHAAMVQRELEERGIPCATVFGETPAEQRDAIIARYRAGEIRAIANVGVLTTGFDAPQTDVIALMRPTQSPGLYVQMVGRGLRKAEGKTDCLVLDFGGNILRHGPIDEVRVREPGKSDGEFAPPVKKCPECMLFVAIAVTVCPRCGFVFPTTRGEPNHDERADTSSALIGGKSNGFERWAVQRVTYTEHVKPGKPVSMRVTYFCGWHKTVSEWVCFEHQGFAKQKAAAWWKARGGQLPVPETVDLARCRIELGEIQRPLEVILDTRKEFPEIKGVKLENNEAGWQADAEDAGKPPRVSDKDYDGIPF